MLFGNKKIKNVYIGKLKVASIPTIYINVGNEPTSSGFCFDSLLYRHINPRSIVLENIPYLDDELPDHFRFNTKTGQITDIYYIMDGLGYIARINAEKPSYMKFENGKIMEETYTSFMMGSTGRNEFSVMTGQKMVGLNSYTLPNKVIYKEDGCIDEDQSVWKFNITRDEIKLMTFKEYKEILKSFNIDPCNFKNHKPYERTLMHMCMNIDLYTKELEQIGIESTIESLLANRKVIEMYYL